MTRSLSVAVAVAAVVLALVALWTRHTVHGIPFHVPGGSTSTASTASAPTPPADPVSRAVDDLAAWPAPAGR